MAIDFPTDVKPGDTYETAGTIYTWTGDRWVGSHVAVPYPIYTKDVLTTDSVTKDGSVLKTQEQVNDFIATATDAVVKSSSRTTSQVDFLQNSVAKGTWEHVAAGVGFPQAGEFWTGDNESDFAKIDKIILNEQGYSADVQGSFSDVRVGDYLTVQERNSASFGNYVISGITTQVIEDQTIRAFDLLLIEGRATGASIPFSSRCQITTSRPTYVIVQDDEPLVSHRGSLWYRENDDVLSISNWETGFTGGIGPQWTEINGAGGGDGDYLPLTGGAITGNLSISGSLSNQGGIMMTAPRDKGFYVYDLQGGAVFSAYGDKFGAGVQYFGAVEQANHVVTKAYTDAHTLQPDKANDVTTSFRVKADGSTLISTSGNELGLYHVKDPTSGNPEWAATKGYVDGEIAKVGGGGGSFQTKYDGNRECIANGISTTTLSSGQVMFLNSQLVSTTQPALVEAIGLPLDDFNWASCIKSGVIKVNSGAYEAGYYQVFKTKEMSGRNMLVYVNNIWFDMDQSLTEGGTPCYFQGMFFE